MNDKYYIRTDTKLDIYIEKVVFQEENILIKDVTQSIKIDK